MPNGRFVLTSHGTQGGTGRATGWYPPGASHPHAGLASRRGGETPTDPGGRGDDVSRAFPGDPAVGDGLHSTAAQADADPAARDAVFPAGGHGTMWDFRGDPDPAGVHGGGVVGAVCHGPAGLTDVVPFPPRDAPRVAGARAGTAPGFAANTVVAGRPVTGRNPASARGVGEGMGYLPGAATTGRGTR
ncbi:MAG: type 1 glutamine amidotransferase domain-containing protein [Thermoleophilia bacterium]|nr:type 1 glutamine amidotransferase domain-containing protein [Thermoleophilia bacterium]